MLEIERKFLILDPDAFKRDAFRETRIVQAYLNSAAERTVRVRIRGEKGYLTIKGQSSRDGLSRFEWEKVIPVAEAEALVKISEPGVIEKIRYEVRSGNHIFEIDEFLGDNKGLFLAEIELEHEQEDFVRPKWLGREVTGDKRYYNSSLIKFPFREWQNKTI